MATCNRMRSRSLQIPNGADGAVVVGNGREGVLHGASRVGLTFAASNSGGVVFTLAHHVRRLPGGPWAAVGTDTFNGGTVVGVDLADVTGHEYRATLTHDSAAPQTVAVECVFQRGAS